MKIDAQEPLKLINSCQEIIYTCFVVCFVVKETSIAGFLDDESCIHNLPSEFLHFRVPVHQFPCFFLLIGLKFHVDYISLY